LNIAQFALIGAASQAEQQPEDAYDGNDVAKHRPPTLRTASSYWIRLFGHDSSPSDGWFRDRLCM
jgi:hypothetical protein